MPEPLTVKIDRLRIEQARLKRGLLAPVTQFGYAYDWKMFETWASGMQLASMPATTETVSLYLTDLIEQGKKPSTAARRACAIAHAHREAGIESPVTRDVRRIMTGARRLLGYQPREMNPLTVEELRTIALMLSRQKTVKAARNQAMLVVGFASALRRESLTALRLEDAEFVPQGLILHIGREKNHREGRMIGLPAGEHEETCPVRCLQAWLSHRGAGPGYLFTGLRKDYHGQGLRGAAVCSLVKGSVKGLGIDPVKYGAHSLRAGFITAAGEANIGLLLIAATSGHRNLNVLRRYFRRMDLFKANASGMVGM